MIQIGISRNKMKLILAGVLLFIGSLLYNIMLTWNKIVGIVICLIGLVFINLKT